MHLLPQQEIDQTCNTTHSDGYFKIQRIRMDTLTSGYYAYMNILLPSTMHQKQSHLSSHCVQFLCATTSFADNNMEHTDCTCGRKSCIRRLEQKRRETAYLNKHLKGVTINVTIPQSFEMIRIYFT